EGGRAGRRAEARGEGSGDRAVGGGGLRERTKGAVPGVDPGGGSFRAGAGGCAARLACLGVGDLRAGRGLGGGRGSSLVLAWMDARRVEHGGRGPRVRRALRAAGGRERAMASRRLPARCGIARTPSPAPPPRPLPARRSEPLAQSVDPPL